MWYRIAMDHAKFKQSGLKPVKCATGIYRVIKDDWDLLPKQFKDDFTAFNLAKAKRTLESVYTFSNSMFTIHYDTTGPNAVPDSDIVTLTDSGYINLPDGIPDYVEWVAASLDTAYRYIVRQLGYSYSMNRIGIRMRELGNTYGLTYMSDSIDLENDMHFFDPDSIDIKGRYDVTVAHEFFHKVQFGYTMDFNFFNEPSATWMEDKMYPLVNDYLQYLDDPSWYTDTNERFILSYPDYPLDRCNTSAPGNYDKVVWPKFLDEYFRADIIRFAWEQYGSKVTNTVTVFDNALRQYNPALSFSAAFADFGKWLFYTGPRSSLCPTFADAALWSAVRVDTVNYQSFVQDTLDLQKLSLQYKVISDRQNHEIGFQINNNTDSLGLYTVRIVNNTAIQDSLLVAAYPMFDINWWALTSDPEIFSLFNNTGHSKSVICVIFDSIYVFYANEVRENMLIDGFSTRITMNSDIVCVRKDTSGTPDSAGWYLFSLINNNAGIEIEKLSGHSFNGHNLFSHYRIYLDTLLLGLIESGRISFSISIPDPSTGYIINRVFVSDSATGREWVFNDEGRAFTLDFSRTGTDFGSEAVRNGKTCKVLHLYTTGSNGGFSVQAFPNPVYSDNQKFFIALNIDTSYTPDADCYIYTLSGMLVRSLKTGNTGEFVDRLAASRGETSRNVFVWDIKNKAGNRVPSGIYLYYLKSRNSESLRGKIAVVGGRNH